MGIHGMNSFIYNPPTEWSAKEYFPDLSKEKLKLKCYHFWEINQI